ncbi:MAG: DUF21 domain-containing protein [Candidatus Krumholzibacteriota bacterium]|nr:DUF21 domain-containing protein [Candidatus Krumholzibacteriota bacterium]
MSEIESIIVIVVALMLTGFFSGSETALVACSKVKLRNRAKQGSWRARVLENLLDSPERFFSIVLVGTNLSVVICTATATALAVSQIGDSGALVATVVMTPLLLIFGEVIPKSAFLYHADRISILIAPFLKIIPYLLWPLVIPSTWLARVLTNLVGGDPRRFNILSTQEELIYLYRRGKQEGSTEERERRIIDRVIRLNKVHTEDLMVPLESVISFSVSSSVDEVIAEANKHTYSRFPLLSPEGGRVVGIISLFDLLGLDGGEKLSAVMHSPFLAHRNEYADHLLIRMKDEPHHFAIVVDDEGTNLGIVTLEDILENIIGDISNDYQL